MPEVNAHNLTTLNSFALELIQKLGEKALDYYGKGDPKIQFDERLITESELHLTESFQEQLEKSFVDGYGGLPDVPIPVLVACETMARVYRIWGAISHSTRFPHHKLEAIRYIKNHVRWLTNNEQPKSLVWSSFR